VVGCVDWETQLIAFPPEDTAQCQALYLAHHQLAPDVYTDQLKRYPTQEYLVRAIVEDLAREGWRCSQELRANASRIDIVAERGGVWRFIEVKRHGDGHTMAHALGQLLFAGFGDPTAALYVATLQRPAPHVLAILASYNIQLLEGSWCQPR
jgi:hypothetical protein